MVIAATVAPCKGLASLARTGVPFRGLIARFYSSRRGNHTGWTLADEASDQEAEASPLGRALNQVYEDYRCQVLTPSWLPLRPESSFFIPSAPPLTKILEKRPSAPTPSPMTLEELRFAINPLGWTSSEAVERLQHLNIPMNFASTPELQKVYVDLVATAARLEEEDDNSR